MTTPGQLPPDGAMVLGTIGQAQNLTENQIQSIIRGQSLSPWSSAQSSLALSYTRQETTWREVTRLDNRIDMLINDNQLVQLATYSTNDLWVKPKGAVQVTVQIVPGGSSGWSQNGSDSTPAEGGYTGPLERQVFRATELPDEVPVTIGSGGAKPTVANSATPGGISRFGTFLSANGGLTTGFQDPTTGAGGNRVRGGKGGSSSGNQLMGFQPLAGSPGGTGSFHPGGAGGSIGQPGENGYSITEVGQVGFGSGGGGGGSWSGYGGDGGWPGAPGGGGGLRAAVFDPVGGGGAGAGGAVWVMTTLEDPFGLPPTAPSGLHAPMVTYTSIMLRWTASSDDVAVAKYEILDGSGTVIGQTGGIEQLVSNLAANTDYTFAVRAVDLGGSRSDPTPNLTVRTTLT